MGSWSISTSNDLYNNIITIRFHYKPFKTIYMKNPWSWVKALVFINLKAWKLFWKTLGWKQTLDEKSPYLNIKESHENEE